MKLGAWVNVYLIKTGDCLVLAAKKSGSRSTRCKVAFISI